MAGQGDRRGRIGRCTRGGLGPVPEPGGGLYRQPEAYNRSRTRGTPVALAAKALGRSRDFCDSRRVESVLDGIGNTPLVRLRRCAPANGAELWLKLEYT